MENWKFLEKVLNGKRVKMTDNGIIYANHNGSIYKTALELGQVRYIGEVYKGNVYLNEEVKEKEHIECNFIKDIREETYRRLFFTIVRYINSKKWDRDEFAIEYVKKNIGEAIYNYFEYGEFFILNDRKNRKDVCDESFRNIFFKMTGKELDVKELIRLYHDNSYNKFIKEHESSLINAFAIQKFVIPTVKELGIEKNIEEYERQYKYAKKLLEVNLYEPIIVRYDANKTGELLDKVIKEWTVCRIRGDELCSKFNIQHIKYWKESFSKSGFCGGSCARIIVANKMVGKSLKGLANELFGKRSRTPIALLGNKELEKEVMDYFSDMKNMISICNELKEDILNL